MSSDEQQQFEGLRDQLAAANRSAEEARSYFCSELGRSTNEARLYRGLFWILLGFVAAFTMLRLLQR